jgi:hypothetical protein
MDTRATVEIGAIAAALDIPQLFYFAELTRFNQDGLDGNTVGMILPPGARARIMASWFTQPEVNREYVGIIHLGKDGSSDLAKELVPFRLHRMAIICS